MKQNNEIRVGRKQTSVIVVKDWDNQERDDVHQIVDLFTDEPIVSFRSYEDAKEFFLQLPYN